MAGDRNQRGKGMGTVLPLVLAAVFLCIFIILFVFLFIWGGMSFTRRMEQPTASEVPNGADYDLSKFAKCNFIWEYLYDSDGNLRYSYGYRERDDNSGRWSLQREEVYYYDRSGRLTKMEFYLPYLSTKTPEYVTTYQYDKQTGQRTEVVRDIDDGTEKKTVYDSEERIVEQDGYIYYYGDESGKLYSIVGRNKESRNWEVVSALRWNLDEFYSIETMETRKDNYVVWLDFYNQDWQHISGVWCEGGPENSDRTREEMELIGRPGYYADYYDGMLLEEMIYQRTHKVDGYESNCYNFYDYDEEGRTAWQGYCLTFDNCIILYQYIYNEEGLLTTERNYRITGDWEQTLTDGSTIAFHRNEKGYLTDITRTDAAGDLIHSFLFDEKRKLQYQVGSDGEIETYWQLTGAEYLALLEEKAKEESREEHLDTPQDAPAEEDEKEKFVWD